MNNRMKIYLTLSIILALWITFYMKAVMGDEVQLPVTVTIINCVDYPDDERCIRLDEIEPASGDDAEEQETIEHFE